MINEILIMYAMGLIALVCYIAGFRRGRSTGRIEQARKDLKAVRDRGRNE